MIEHSIQTFKGSKESQKILLLAHVTNKNLHSIVSPLFVKSVTNMEKISTISGRHFAKACVRLSLFCVACQYGRLSKKNAEMYHEAI